MKIGFVCEQCPFGNLKQYVKYICETFLFLLGDLCDADNFQAVITLSCHLPEEPMFHRLFNNKSICLLWINKAVHFKPCYLPNFVSVLIQSSQSAHFLKHTHCLSTDISRNFRGNRALHENVRQWHLEFFCDVVGAKTYPSANHIPILTLMPRQ